MNKVLIVIPVYNEEKIISQNLKKLYDYAKLNLPGHIFNIIVADNNSNDQTGSLVKELPKLYPEIDYEFYNKKGKGLAVIRTWQKYQDDFDIFMFMDADLSTDLDALPKLISSIISGDDIAIGSRYQKGAIVQKPFLRKVISGGYRLILHLLLDTKIKDFPCGFKAINKKTLQQIVPKIKNDQFFFDSEMLYLAEKNGFKINEIPVTWQEPREKNDSKVNLLSVAWRYFQEVLRVKKENSQNRLSKSEKNFLWLLSLILAIITILPVIFGYLISEGKYYPGIHLWFFDGNVYLSYINQIKDEGFLVHNLFSNEINNIPVFNPFWFLIGLIGKVLNLSAPLALHLGRTLLIPVFIFTLYKFISFFLINFSPTIKKLCLLFSLLAAGLGGYYVLYTGLRVDDINFPMDIWVPETINFQALFDSPHFIASITLIILIFYFFIKATENNSMKCVIYAGILSLILFSFHPYYVAVIYSITALYLFYLFLKNKKIIINLIFYYLLLIIISLPSIFYYALLLFNNDFFRIKTSQNTCGSPTWAGFFIGYGFLVFFAIFAQIYFIIEQELSNKKIFLMVWFWATILLMYFPVVFQRRFSEGFQIPLTILAFYGLLIIYNELKKYWHFLNKNYSIYLLILFIPLFCFSNIYVYFYSFGFLAGVAKKTGYFYTDKETTEALNWYKSQTTYKETLLCSFGQGATIPALINRRVYFGHGMETLNAESKGAEVEMFYKDNINDEQKKLFLKNNRIDYILYSDLEKNIGQFDPYHKEYLELIFANEAVAIFKLK